MEITGLTLDDFTEIAEVVSTRLYEGNIAVTADAYDKSNTRTDKCIARVRAINSRGPGARRTTSGKLRPDACWHAYRDVLDLLFQKFPEARVDTGMARYRGKNGFLRDYPATAHKNVGTQSHPVTMPELCDCPDSIRFRLEV